LFILSFCLLLAGCGGGGSGANPVASALTNQGEANLTVNFKLPDGTNAPISSLRAAVVPQVNFEIGLVQPGNLTTPVMPLRKSVSVENGSASVNFSSLPLKPAFCKVEILGGNKGGYSTFRGALQLVAGQNEVDVVPEGSKMKEDLLAGVLEALTTNLTEFAKISEDVIAKIEAVITNLVGTDVTDDMAMMAFTNPNPEPVEVPVQRTVAEPLNTHVSQVKVAVKESLTTALDGFRTSLRASSVNPVPSSVPLLGEGNQINIGAMLQILPEILPGGSSATDMPGTNKLAENGTQTFIIEYTPSSIKYKKINVKTFYDFTSYPYIVTIATSAISLVTFTGINVEAATSYNREGEIDGKYISRVTGDTGWQMTLEELDPETEVLQRKFTVAPENGFQFDISQTREYEIGTYTTSLWGTFIDYYAVSTQTIDVSFQGNEKFNVLLEEPGKSNSNFWLSLEGLNGHFTSNQTLYLGKQGWGNGFMAYLDPVEGKNYIDVNSENLLEVPTFVNNQLTIKAGGNYVSEGVELQSLQLTLPNIARTSNTEAYHLVDYTFSGASGNVSLKYTGNQPELYGYIYMLQVAISNMNFNSALEYPVSDGTQFVVTKTSTDNTNNVLTYKIINGKAVLQPVTQNFTGGSETISSDGTTTTIEGGVAVTGTDDVTVNLNYSTNKTNEGAITVKIDMVVNHATYSMFFSRDALGEITGRFYLTQKTADDNIGLLANFTISKYGMGIMTYAEGSGFSGTTYFNLSL
jgi:hypothetical protein